MNSLQDIRHKHPEVKGKRKLNHLEGKPEHLFCLASGKATNRQYYLLFLSIRPNNF